MGDVAFLLCSFLFLTESSTSPPASSSSSSPLDSPSLSPLPSPSSLPPLKHSVLPLDPARLPLPPLLGLKSHITIDKVYRYEEENKKRTAPHRTGPDRTASRRKHRLQQYLPTRWRHQAILPWPLGRGQEELGVHFPTS